MLVRSKKMQVYIEYVLIENFLIDTALLVLSLLTARCTLSKLRLLFCGIAGAFFALVFPVFIGQKQLEILLKIGVGAGLSFCSLKKSERKKYPTALLFFFVYSGAFAGVLIAVFGLINRNGKTYEMESLPLGATLASLIFCGLFVKAKIKRFQKRLTIGRLIYRVEIEHGDNAVQGNGFFDSGNLAFPEKSGLYFCSQKIADGLKLETAKKEYVQVDTVAGGERLGYVKVKRLTVYSKDKTHTIVNACLTVSPSLCGKDYDVLLSGYTFES